LWILLTMMLFKCIDQPGDPIFDELCLVSEFHVEVA
jgi:hypothetical protein